MKNHLQYAPCFYFSFSDDGIIKEVNGTLCQKLGYKEEELVGEKTDRLFTLATRIFNQTHFFPLLKMKEHVEEIFITLETKAKEAIPVLVNAQRTEEGLNVCVGITVPNRKKFEDELVGARNAAEKALKENTELVQAKEQLQQHAEQLDQHIFLLHQQHSELKQFNWVVTHDLQEPLRKLLVFGNMLKEAGEASGAETLQPIVQKLLKVSAQMRTIVSGLQQYVWLNQNANKITEVNLNKLLLVVQQQLAAEYSSELLVLETDILPELKADWDQMQLLFYHLLSNAVKFRKEGTKAHVRITGTVLQQNRFRSMPGKYRYEDHVKLRIEDKGKGFDADFKNQVFTLFKRLHNEPGRGLGLSLSKKIVENHQGTITADSKPGEGTVITIILPLEPVMTETVERMG